MVFGQDLDRTLCPEARLIRLTRGASGMPRHATPDGGFKHAAGLAFLAVWSIIGLAAFFMSLACFTRAGSTGPQNMIGLLLALLLGPFYWLYYLGSGSYCTASTDRALASVIRGVKARG